MSNTFSNEVITLLNEIYAVPEDSLLDKILSYCEMNDYSIQEIGDILGESKQFQTKLWIDCVDNNVIRDVLLKEKQNSTDDMDDW